MELRRGKCSREVTAYQLRNTSGPHQKEKFPEEVLILRSPIQNKNKHEKNLSTLGELSEAGWSFQLAFP